MRIDNSLFAMLKFFKSSSIKVAEAAKIIENSQRDINIAFINELTQIFDKLNIRKKFVLDRAWWTSVLILICFHATDIPLFDSRVNLLGWILLIGLRCIIIDPNMQSTRFKES